MYAKLVIEALSDVLKPSDNKFIENELKRRFNKIGLSVDDIDNVTAMDFQEVNDEIQNADTFINYYKLLDGRILKIDINYNPELVEPLEYKRNFNQPKIQLLPVTLTDEDSDGVVEVDPPQELSDKLHRVYKLKDGRLIDVNTIGEYKLLIINESLNESSYTDFLTMNSEQIEIVKDKLKSIAVSVFKGDYTEADVVDALSVLEQIYDPEVPDAIFNWIEKQGNVTNNELATLGIDIQNKYGTEMKMVLNAIEDFVFKLKKAKRNRENNES